MEIKNAFLVAVTILNLTWGVLIYWQNKKSSINKAYGMMSLGIAGWALTNAFFQEVITTESALFWARWSDVSTIILVSSLFYFSLVFPKEISLPVFKKYIKYLFYYLTTGLLILSILLPEFIRKDVVFIEKTQKQIITEDGFYLFAAYVIIFILWSIINLIKKYKFSRGITKIQLKYVFVGLSISALFGISFNLILPIFNDYRFVWLGPNCALILLVFVGYAVVKHHLMNIKVVATELFTFVIWVFFLIKALISYGTKEFFLNLVLFAVIVFLGSILIRGVWKEVRQREKIEKMSEEINDAYEKTRRAYEVEKKAHKELERLNEAKTQFSLATQHHLRTPLTSMNGYLDLLLGGTYGKLPKKIREVLEKFAISTKNEIKIVNELLDISQFQMGKEVVFLKDNVKIEEIVNQAVNDVKLEAEKKKIYLKTKIPENLPIIKADFNKLRMAIYNIIDNAVKYTNEGGITIRIKELANKIVIIIKDTGAGIPRDYQKDMFNKMFERGTGAMKMFATGKGIGLFITSKIIAGHGGKIWVKSEGNDKGSTFFIELPIDNNKKD